MPSDFPRCCYDVPICSCNFYFVSTATPVQFSQRNYSMRCGLTDHPKIRAAQIPTLLVERDLLGVEMLSELFRSSGPFAEFRGHGSQVTAIQAGAGAGERGSQRWRNRRLSGAGTYPRT